METITRIRNLIGDSHKSDVVTFVSDGSSLVYQLPRTRIKTGSVVSTHGDISTVDINTGLVTFADPIEEFQSFQISFSYSSFTNEEIAEYIGIHHTVNNTSIELLQILLADSARRYDYSTGLENFKPSQVFEHIKDLITMIKSQGSGLSSYGGAVQQERTSEYGILTNLYTDNEPTEY
jgi:hypothetical protein